MSTLRANNLESLETGRVLEIDELPSRADLAGDPADGLGAALVNGTVIRVTSVSALSGIDAVEGYQALVLGVPFIYKSGSWVPSAGFVTLDAYGANRTGADNSAAFSALTSALTNFEGVILGLPGTYYTDGTLEIPRRASFKAAGINATFISAKNSTGTFTNNAVVLKRGVDPTLMADLSTNTEKGDVSVSFDAAHLLSTGDVFLIYNPVDYSFSDWRPVYRDGEFCTVVEVVSSTEVLVEKPIYASHDSSVVSVYRCNQLATGDLEDFTAIAPGDSSGNNITRALSCLFWTLSSISRVGATNSDNASQSISMCYKITGRDLYAHQWGQNPGFGTQYGLSIGNSQELDITGKFTGYRHGIALGGGASFSIPNRDVHVHTFRAKNNSGSIASADWHGNVEHCSYKNGVIHNGGLNISGNNNTISGITGGGPDMMVILGREILGCNHTIQDIDVWTGRNDTARGLLNIGGNESAFTADTKYGGTFSFSRIKVNAPNAERQCIVIRNRGFIAEPWRVVAKDIEYTAPNSNSVSFPITAILTVSGNSPVSIDVTGATSPASLVTPALSLGSSDASTLVRGLSLAGTVEVPLVSTEAVATATVDFRNFAKNPVVLLSLYNFTTGADRIGSYVSSVSVGSLGAIVRRIDVVGSNFSGDITATVAWSAEINEF